MGRSRKKAAEAAPTSSNLLDALKFLDLITKDIGSPNETHIWLSNNWAMCYNGILAAAQKIDNDIIACPHNSTLLQALSKCGQSYSIGESSNTLVVKSDKFKAIVPCIDAASYQMATPDAPIIEINDKFREGLEAVSTLASPDAQQIALASILINGKSFVSTTGVMLFEYWHGLELPENIAVPKVFADVVVKSSKKLKSFGYSTYSITVWFTDDSWLKTQLYSEPWPDVAKILNAPCDPKPVSGALWKALAAVAGFSPDGLVHVGPGVLTSHKTSDQGASYEVSGLPQELSFSAKQLMLIKPYAETIDFEASGRHGNKCLMFYGKAMRGVIAGRTS